MNTRSQSPVSQASRDAIARAWADRRDRAARETYQRGIAAETRAYAVLSGEASDLMREARISPDLARVLVSIGGAEIVTRAGDSATGAIKPATAARSTRELSERLDAGEAIACGYALDRDVTGALPSPRMRVRGPGKRTGHAATVCRDATPRPLPSADTMTGAREASHGKACADLARAFQARNDSTGAARKAATSQIRAIVAIWTGDHDIAVICRANDWTINA